mmetsp:Transcript_13185/g.39910  ORF Transcript_13185/g.39910 Transcript_13185/m.39910 type:complete len:202 (-) Transcript_13185:203-808(-)
MRCRRWAPLRASWIALASRPCPPLPSPSPTLTSPSLPSSMSSRFAPLLNASAPTAVNDPTQKAVIAVVVERQHLFKQYERLSSMSCYDACECSDCGYVHLSEVHQCCRRLVWLARSSASAASWAWTSPSPWVPCGFWETASLVPTTPSSMPPPARSVLVLRRLHRDLNGHLSFLCTSSLNLRAIVSLLQQTSKQRPISCAL